MALNFLNERVIRINTDDFIKYVCFILKYVRWGWLVEKIVPLGMACEINSQANSLSANENNGAFNMRVYKERKLIQALVI